MQIRFIGDVHGQYDQYLELCECDTDYIIQLGDLGFEYSVLDKLDPARYKVLGGNHDNYPELIKRPHYLGDFGLLESGIFFIRGAKSIDRHFRIEGRDWWREEELSFSEAMYCIQDYNACEPRIVFSHDGPASIIERLFNFTDHSYTRKLLEQLLVLHQPHKWIFGHHHKPASLVKNNTKFVCLGTLQYLDLEI